MDLALVAALREAEHDLAGLHEHVRALERALGDAVGENRRLEQQVDAALDRARHIEGALALHRIEASARPAGRLDATICTVVSTATMAHAHALGRSLARVHPGTELLAILTDDARVDRDAPFTAVPLDAVLGPEASVWRSRHRGIALEYALTPVAIRHALARSDRPAIFIKQESMVVGDLQPLLDELGPASVALTPHFLEPPVGADAAERTRDVLLAGTFNGGVIVAANHARTREAMTWWEDRMAEECFKDVERGRHFEQRWLDLMAATFASVIVIRNPGANIGHWNIADRHITVGPEGLHANGSPVVVLRFSGIDVDQPGVVTRYAPHRLYGELGPLGDYFTAFRHELMSHEAA